MSEVDEWVERAQRGEAIIVQCQVEKRTPDEGYIVTTSAGTECIIHQDMRKGWEFEPGERYELMVVAFRNYLWKYPPGQPVCSWIELPQRPRRGQAVPAERPPWVSKQDLLAHRHDLGIVKLSELEVGDTVEGQVYGVKPYGTFFDVDGASVLAKGVQDLTVGDKAMLKITAFDPPNRRVEVELA